MRRTLLLLAALILLATPALAIPGKDPVDSNTFFEISVVEDVAHANPPPLPADTYEVERFQEGQGWDFGDRYAYQCAWVEFFQGTNERFEVHYELRKDYPFDLKIGDRNGVEIEGGGEQTRGDCGTGIDFGAVPTHDGTDHFPHMIHPGDGITFYQDGEQFQYLDLSRPACSKSYWVPGDEPGEAWLWWDEDGPTFSHGEGEGELPCGGGPGEAVAVVRLEVKNADPDIGYCTVDEFGSQCFNVEPPPTPVTLGTGRSILTCPGGGTPVVLTTQPLVVRCT